MSVFGPACIYSAVLSHTCMRAFVPIASVMILPRLHADRVLRVIHAFLVCVDLLRLSWASGLLGLPG